MAELKKVGRQGYVAPGGWAVNPVIGAPRTEAGIRWKVRKSGTTTFKFVKTLGEARDFIDSHGKKSGGMVTKKMMRGGVAKKKK